MTNEITRILNDMNKEKEEIEFCKKNIDNCKRASSGLYAHFVTYVPLRPGDCQAQLKIKLEGEIKTRALKTIIAYYSDEKEKHEKNLKELLSQMQNLNHEE